MKPIANPTPLEHRRLAPVERLHRSAAGLTASFEFFPPRTPALRAGLEETIDRLIPLRPTFVSVTYGAGGTTRSETFDTIIALRSRGLDVAAHLTCIGHTRAEIRELAERYRDAGINRIVALRGDPPAGEAPTGEMAHATDLVSELREAGVEHVTVAAFPEGHPETNFDLDLEIENLKRKEAAGASQAITQFCLENDVLLRYVDRARRPVSSSRSCRVFSRWRMWHRRARSPPRSVSRFHRGWTSSLRASMTTPLLAIWSLRRSRQNSARILPRTAYRTCTSIRLIAHL